MAPVSVFAAEPQLICFGNEPSWGLQFSEQGRARLLLPEQKPLDYRGRETRLDFLKERAWRGKPASGKGGEVVAFLRESACSDGMSNTTHPVTVRVSLPDSRLLAGCCRIPVSSNATSAPVPIAFEGPTWQLAAPGAQSAGVDASEKRSVTALFEGGRVSGFSGCNRFMGSYTLDRDSVLIGPLAGTMMACPEPQMAIEKAFLGALTGTLRHAISGDRLTLTPATGAPLVFQVEPAPMLQGVNWSVTGFNNGRQAVVGPLLGTTLTLTFDQGQVYGSSGCNTYRAAYTSEGNRLAIGPVASTRKACSAEGVMQQEREFLAAIESVKVWTISGGMLDIHRADGERVLNAIKAAR
ncbi:META domain-containing protein [Propionivibrio sp.]|uniref:META domain-containing protein n=1 Tax=Propionivibrio sp. TaxID=2212460 RepID=UPI003BF28103